MVVGEPLVLRLHIHIYFFTDNAYVHVIIRIHVDSNTWGIWHGIRLGLSPGADGELPILNGEMNLGNLAAKSREAWNRVLVF